MAWCGKFNFVFFLPEASTGAVVRPSPQGGLASLGGGDMLAVNMVLGHGVPGGKQVEETDVRVPLGSSGTGGIKIYSGGHCRGCRSWTGRGQGAPGLVVSMYCRFHETRVRHESLLDEGAALDIAKVLIQRTGKIQNP